MLLSMDTFCPSPEFWSSWGSHRTLQCSTQLQQNQVSFPLTLHNICGNCSNVFDELCAVLYCYHRQNTYVQNDNWRDLHLMKWALNEFTVMGLVWVLHNLMTMSVFVVGLRACVCCPYWWRTAPVRCSNSTACLGCALCSRSYRWVIKLVSPSLHLISKSSNASVWIAVWVVLHLKTEVSHSLCDMSDKKWQVK